MMSVQRAKLVILMVSILAVPLSMAQVGSPVENTPTMSDREQYGLRGPVKSCTEESTFSGVTDGDGKTYPGFHSESTTEYDADGRTLATRSRSSDGSEWATLYSYGPSGRLLMTRSGIGGQSAAETTYSYDQQGRLENIIDANRPDSPVAYRYDEQGRKSQIQIFRASDYRPDVVAGGSPFEATGRVPNLPGGGSATTIYDEHDRATEIQVRDANGELVNRAVRTYDAQGHVMEEKQILDSPESMFPAEVRAKMLEESGLSDDQLRQELRAQLTKLMGGQPGPYSVSYSYDDHGRVNHMNRRIFSQEQEIETTYNDHGDTASEVTRSAGSAAKTDPATPVAGLPPYSEVRYSYQYDQYGNWIEKAVSSRWSPDGAFESSPSTSRTLRYY
jgi:YD repeat-containing protein